jgi:hypothetical protein
MRARTAGLLPARKRERCLGGSGGAPKSGDGNSTGNKTGTDRLKFAIAGQLTDAQLLEKAREIGDGDAWVTLNALCVLPPDRISIIQKRVGPRTWLIDVRFLHQACALRTQETV